MTRNAALAVLALAALYAVSSAGTWTQIPAQARQVTSILHIGAAVVLVALATAMTWGAVRAVSSRPVIRVHHRDHDMDEPPLPCHKPEPEHEEDARPALAPSRQASALPLPGRAPEPEPESQEVPR